MKDLTSYGDNLISEFSKLPVIILQRGEYVTRDGRRVSIPYMPSDPKYSINGTIWVMFRGKLRPRKHKFWVNNGRRSIFHEMNSDIVGPWIEN